MTSLREAPARETAEAHRIGFNRGHHCSRHPSLVKRLTARLRLESVYVPARSEEGTVCIQNPPHVGLNVGSLRSFHPRCSKYHAEDVGLVERDRKLQLVSRELLDLITEHADDEIVFPPERWAATFRSHAQLLLQQLGEFLGYSPPPLLERLIGDAQKTNQQRPILQERLATVTQPTAEA